MKQTAVEWLFDNLVKVKDVPFEEQANAILKAFEQAYEQTWAHCGSRNHMAEQYYNETFKSDGLVQNSL